MKGARTAGDFQDKSAKRADLSKIAKRKERRIALRQSRRLSASPWPMRDVCRAHEIGSTTNRRKDSGVPRAVFEACSATTPEDRHRGPAKPGGFLVILRRSQACADCVHLSARDPRPVSRIIAAWASAGCDTSFAPNGHRIPPRVSLTLMKRPFSRDGIKGFKSYNRENVKRRFDKDKVIPLCPRKSGDPELFIRICELGLFWIPPEPTSAEASARTHVNSGNDRPRAAGDDWFRRRACAP